MIRRLPVKTQFTTLPYDIAQNPKLSARGLGVLVYILSKPDHWKVRVIQLAARFTDEIFGQTCGRDVIYKIIDEHIALGYCRKVKVRTSGKFNSTEYHYTESPLPEIPDTVKPDTVKPDTVFQDALVSIEEAVKIEKEVNIDSSCPEPEKNTGPVPPVSDYPTNKNGSVYTLSWEHYQEFVKNYPAVDVDQQLRNARMWLITNPGKRKTQTGMLTFLNKWLSKEQNRGGNHGQRQTYQQQPSLSQRGDAAIERAFPSKPAGDIFDGNGNLLDD